MQQIEDGFYAIGAKVKHALRLNKSYVLLDSEPGIAGSTWTAGACYPLAMALQKLYGGNLYAIRDSRTNGISHVMVKIGNGYLDADGYQNESEKIKTAITEGAVAPWISPLRPKDNLSDLGHGSPAFIEKLAKMIADSGTKRGLPGRITRLPAKKKSEGGVIDEDDTSYKTLLSLFDFSGTWAEPFRLAGWNVIRWDIKLSEFMDINLIESAEFALEEFGDVNGIIAAPPCTDFTTSGNQWWKFKDETGQTHKSIQLVNQVMKLVDLYEPTDPEYDGVWFWAIENPVGRMGKLVGLPMEPWYFDPCEFAGYLDLSKKDLQRLEQLRKKQGIGLTMDDAMFVQRTNAYKKKTGLWGEFRIPEPKKPIEPVYAFKGGQRSAPIDALTGGKSARTKELRSNTPLGFARAFFEANKNYRAHLQPIVEEKTKKGKPKNSSKVTYFGKNDEGEPYRWERVSLYDEYCTNPDEITIYESEKALIVIEYAELESTDGAGNLAGRWFYNTRILKGDESRDINSKYRVYASRRNFATFMEMIQDATETIRQAVKENEFPKEAVDAVNEFASTKEEMKTGGAVTPVPATPAELRLRWNKKKNSVKNIAGAIQSLKNNLTRDLKSENEKTRLVALVIWTMIKTYERIGNKKSSEEDGHYGVTFFKKRHLDVNGNSVSLKYVAKSGVEQNKQFSDEKIAEQLEEAKDNSPDSYIFTTSEGRKITPAMIDNYLRPFGVKPKDIRGLSCNALILKKLKTFDNHKDPKEREKQFREAVKYAAERVGHGAPTLKKHYLIPELEEKYLKSGQLLNLAEFTKDRKDLGGELVTHYQLPQMYLSEGGTIKMPVEIKSVSTHKVNPNFIDNRHEFLPGRGSLETDFKDREKLALGGPFGEDIYSGSFKQWFGDLENARRSVPIINIDDSIHNRDVKNVRKWGKKNLTIAEGFPNDDLGVNFLVSGVAVEKITSETKGDMNLLICSLKSLKEIVKSAILGYEKPDRNNDANIFRVYKLYACIKNAKGELFSVRLTVKKLAEQTDKTKFIYRLYDYRIYKIKNPAGTSGSVVTKTIASQPAAGFTTKLINLLVKTKPYDAIYVPSVVVNTDGMPLICYHGTINKQYRSYNYLYFSSEKDYALKFAGGEGKLILAYINIRIPLIIEATYLGYGEIVLDNKIIGFYRNLMPEAVKKLKEAGYDGIIVNYGDRQKLEVIPFDEEQIRIILGDIVRYKTGGQPGPIKTELTQLYNKWKGLVNMSYSELLEFYGSPEGKEAGLSAHEAKELGIRNGRQSARWILRMKKTPVAQWTKDMWDWAKHQVNFITRMKENKGELYDKSGNRTRKLTSLLIWGHNPEKKKLWGGEMITNYQMPDLYMSDHASLGFVDEARFEHGGQPIKKADLTLNNVVEIKGVTSSSAVEVFNDRLYVVGDDATGLMITDKQFRHPKYIQLFEGGNERVAKALKADLEASALIDLPNKQPAILFIGSASRETRKSFVTVPVTSPDKFKIISGADFWKRVEKKLGVIDRRQLNVEAAATIDSETFILSNRNLLEAKNNLIITSPDFYRNQVNCPIRIAEIVTPPKKGMFLGVSGMCHIRGRMNRDVLMITCSVEDSIIATDDGTIGNSYLGWINNISQKLGQKKIEVDGLINLSKYDARFKGQKIEGVAWLEGMKHRSNSLSLVLVSDNDTGTSMLFDVEIVLPVVHPERVEQGGGVSFPVDKYQTKNAYADVNKRGDVWEISMIESSKEGEGRAIVEKIIKDATKSSIKKIVLSTTEHSGWGFFNKMGFESGEEYEEDGDFYIPMWYSIGKAKGGPMLEASGAAQSLFAPNRKPSNLSPVQYKLVRTPAFKAWFGDWENDPEHASKVMDENGEPMVIYHGTTKDFTVFRPSKYGSQGKGIYFAKRKEYAHKGYGEPSKIIPVFAKILSNKDGIINEGYEVLVYNPKNVKLADGTNTSFDGRYAEFNWEYGGPTQPATIKFFGIDFVNTFGVSDVDFNDAVFSYLHSKSLLHSDNVTGIASLLKLQSKLGDKYQPLLDYIKAQFKTKHIYQDGGQLSKSLKFTGSFERFELDMPMQCQDEIPFFIRDNGIDAGISFNDTAPDLIYLTRIDAYDEGKGAGTKFLDKLKLFALQNGYAGLFAYPENERSHHFFIKNGFKDGKDDKDEKGFVFYRVEI